MDLIDDVSRSAEQSPIRRLTGQSASRLPAVNVPFYEPEQVPRLAAPAAPATASAPPSLPPPDGPISRAAGMASRAGLAGGAAGLLAGGAAATASAGGSVAADPEYFKTSIGDDGLASNIMLAAQPQRIADVAQQPTTARSQNGPTNVPLIAQVGAQDLGQRFPPMPQQQQADADPAYRAGYLNELQNQAYRESDPIGQIIAQRTGPQSIAQVAQAPAADGIIGGGDTVYSPGMAAQRDPYKTADGRTINPNDANLPAGDRDLISQYQAHNAQMLADMQAEQRANPMNGSVTMIRPGNQVSVAVQTPNGMAEMDPTAHAAYQQAFDKNPQLAQQAQITASGPVINGNAVPAEVIAGGDKALQSFTQASQQDAINKADPLAAQARVKVAETTLNPGVASGTQNATPGAQLSGDAFLGTLDKNYAAQVKKVANYEMPITPMMLKQPLYQKMMSDAVQADPTFDATQYSARQKLRNDAMAGGKIATTNNFMNNALGHLGNLSDIVDSLHTTSGYPGATAVNKAINSYRMSSGDTDLSAFNSIKQHVAGELEKAFKGTPGTLAEMTESMSHLDPSLTKDQLKRNLAEMAKLLHSKVEANVSQYNQGMGKPEDYDPGFVNKEARQNVAKIFQRAGMMNPYPDAGGGQPAAAGSPPAAKPAAPQPDLTALEAEAKRRGLIK